MNQKLFLNELKKKSKSILMFCFCVVAVYNTGCKANAIDAGKQVVFAKAVGDSFEVYILKPKNFSASKKYHIVYFLDANINSGIALTALINKEYAAQQCDSLVFIGIGHKGNFHVKRRRDFLPPKYENGTDEKSNDKDYGHADLFYSFLTEQLAPMVEQNINTTGNRSLIGHSFGGLFAYYALIKPKSFFKNYFALSPSLWVEGSNFFKREEDFFKGQNGFDRKYLYMATGTLEFANYVLSTSRKMDGVLKERNYKNLEVEYVEKNWANHNTHVPLTLVEVLSKIKLRY